MDKVAGPQSDTEKLGSVLRDGLARHVGEEVRPHREGEAPQREQKRHVRRLPAGPAEPDEEPQGQRPIDGIDQGIRHAQEFGEGCLVQLLEVIKKEQRREACAPEQKSAVLSGAQGPGSDVDMK